MCRLQSVIRYHLGANAMLLINRAGDYLTEQTGFGATSRYTAFGKVEQWLRRMPNRWTTAP